VRIEVLEKEMSTPQGENGGLNVTGTVRGGGEKRVNEFVRFTVADERIAKVAAKGAFVEGLFPGQTQIEAYEPMSEKSATFQVTVLPPNLVDILVGPPGQVLPIGEQREFRAVGVIASGKHVELDRPVWSSSDRKTLHVNQNGFATALKRGEADVIVRGRQSDAWGSIGVVCGE
jgi:hypothetical protein